MSSRRRDALVSVNASNVPAIALYEAMGFVSFGHERGCLMIDGVLPDELHMARLLIPAGT